VKADNLGCADCPFFSPQRPAVGKADDRRVKFPVTFFFNKQKQATQAGGAAKARTLRQGVPKWLLDWVRARGFRISWQLPPLGLRRAESGAASKA